MSKVVECCRLKGAICLVSSDSYRWIVLCLEWWYGSSEFRVSLMKLELLMLNIHRIDCSWIVGDWNDIRRFVVIARLSSCIYRIVASIISRLNIAVTVYL